MSFVLRMAVREIRASWQRLLFFFVCIAVGVASIVAIRSVIQSVREGLTREARAMNGADVVVRSDRPLGDEVRASVEQARTSGRVSTVSEAVEIATMVRPPDATMTRMVELRAVQDAYPLYGTMTLREGEYSHALLQNHGTLVRPELLAQLNLRVGEDLLIGTQRFQIRGVIEKEPGRNLGAFSLGSRLFIDFADLPSTGLLSFGSRASYELLLQVPGPPPVPGRRDASTLLARDLSDAFVNDFVRARSYRQNEGRMSENLTRAENYLSLVGLVVLILGGIGVSSVTRVFVQQKVRSIAILKCVGSTTTQVLSVYLAQVLLLGLAGSALGVAIAASVLTLLPWLVGDLAAMLEVQYGLTAGAVIQGLAVGMLVSVLFSVVPLLEIRNVKPSLLLRQDLASVPRFDWVKWGVAVAVGASLVGVAAWQAGSLAVGLVLSGGCASDITCPAEAAEIAGRLGVAAPAIDVASACTSFLAQIRVLSMMRPEALPPFVLLVAQEALTRTVNYEDRASAVLFGDGAAAAVVSTREPGRARVLHASLESDPSASDKVQIRRLGYFGQDGRAVQMFAIRKTLAEWQRLGEARGDEERPLHLVGHQANLRVLQTTCQRAGIDPLRHHSNVELYGNTGAPSALSVVSQEWEKWGPEDDVALIGVGAGLTWGSCLLRFEASA